MFYKDSRNIYRVLALDQIEWLTHGFGTQQAPDIAGMPGLSTLHQIHSDICIAACGRPGVLGDGDALLSNTPGQVVGVKTADCIPILLVDDEHRAVAAVHAGWRGTVAGIARRAVEAMTREFGTRPDHLHAAIGPGIGECCYEVGAEVAAHFGKSGAAHIDLADANRRQLLDAGLSDSHIYLANLCTKCGGDDFHSYRRDKEQAGRMLSFVGVNPEFSISTDPARLDIAMIHEYLSGSAYWATGRSMEVVRHSIENSLPFGVYKDGKQIGFARLVTDYATFAWLADVFILPEYQGRGLGKWLIAVVTAHPRVQGLRRWILATKDAHGLYEQYGFTPLSAPGRFMERFSPQGNQTGAAPPPDSPT